jgi:hypothetical protein
VKSILEEHETEPLAGDKRREIDRIIAVREGVRTKRP